MITNSPKMKYRAYKVSHLTTSGGKKYVRWTLGDNVKDNNGNYHTKDYYTLISWQDGLDNFKDGDNYSIKSITGVDTNEYNGKKYVNLRVEIELKNANTSSSTPSSNSYNDNKDDSSFKTFNIMEDDIQF